MSKSRREITVRDDLWKRVDALAKRKGVAPDEIVQAALVQLFRPKAKTVKEMPAADSGSRPTPKAAAPKKAAPEAPKKSAPPPKKAAPKGPPKAPPKGPPGRSKNRPVYVQYQGSWHTVDKDEYIIGRGSKFSDLPIKDANISRRHCSVVRRDGEYFIQDLGSTNGVEFNGERVDDHQVTEGAVYFLCDHEIRFSFERPS